MSIATEYVVRTRYEVDPKSAESALARVEKSADRAGKSVDGLKSLLLGAMASVAGMGVIGKAREAFIGFNSDMEQAKIQIGGLLQMNLGGTFADGMGKANALVDRLQQRAKLSVGTTADMVDMASGLVAPLTQAGASMKQLEDLTVGAVTASKALRVNSDLASLEVNEALMGNAQKRMRFIMMLGIHPEEINKADPKKRLEILNRALNGPAMRAMAKAQGDSFAGVTSTLSDNLQITLGKIGLPLFKAITAEVTKWNAWFDKNPQRVQEIATSVSKALVSAFTAVKEGMQWVYENRDLLLSLAKAAIIFKVGGAIGGSVGGLLGKLDAAGGSKLFKSFDELSTVMKDVNGQSVKVKSAFSGIAAAAGPLIASFAAGVAIGSALLSYAKREDAKAKHEEGRLRPVLEAANDVAASGNVKEGASVTRGLWRTGILRRSNLTGGVVVDQQAVAKAFGRGLEYDVAKNSPNPNARYVQTQEELIASNNALKVALLSTAENFRQGVGWQYAASGIAINSKVDDAVQKALSTSRPNLKPGNTIIGTLNVEVSAKDPDRWIADFNKKLERVARVRTRARSAMRGRGT
jgi:hypothetical protein